MDQGFFLVTGAAGGRQGSTGHHVARQLLERGLRVRAFVHRDDQRSDDLRALGGEVIEGDLLDLVAVRRAMSNVRRAYFTYPVQPGLVEATTIFATTARERSVERVINLSQMLTRSGEHPTPHQARHWLSEQILDWANVGAVHLNAVVFYENFLARARDSLVKTGAIMLPWGAEDTAFPMIAAEDVARVAVGALTGPALPNGTVVPLIGSVVTIREMVDAFSDALGKPVRYEEIADEQWIAAAASAGINPAAVEHLSHLWRHLRSRPKSLQAAYHVVASTSSETIERIGGAKPKTLSAYLREQALDLSAVPSAASSAS
jgi:uncharacterized protein YbjT (DUF2867 family)